MSDWVSALDHDYHSYAQGRTTAAEKARKLLGARPWTEVLSVEKPDWLITNILQKQSIHVISSPKGCYKTWLGLSTMLSGIYGTSVLGEMPTQRFSTLYVAADSTDWDIAEQLRKLLRGARKLPAPDPDSFILPFGVQFTNEEHVNLLVELISAYEIDHMVIDVKLYTQGNLDENSDAEQMLYFRVIKHFRDKLGVAVTLLHHFGKTTGTPRGAGTVEQAAEHCYELYRGKDSVKLKRSKIRGEADWQERNFTLVDTNGGKLLVPMETSLLAPATVKPKEQDVVLTWLQDGPAPRNSLIALAIEIGRDHKWLDNKLQNLRKTGYIKRSEDGLWSLEATE